MLWFGSLAGAIVLSIVAVVFRLDQLFFIAVTVGAAPWLSWRLSSRGMSQVRATVQTTGRVRLSCGEQRTLRVVLYNHGRMPRILCRAALRLPEGLREVREQSLQADTLAPGATAHLDVRFEGDRRGHYTIGEAEVRTTDQLGVFEFPARIADVEVGVTVWPRRLPIRRSRWLQDANASLGSEETATQQRGAGLDFYGVREWAPGHGLRRIHWPSTARRGKLTVTEFERVGSRDLILVLDLGEGRHTGAGANSTLECRISFAASLATLAIRQGGSVGLIAQGAEDVSLLPGVRDLETVLDRLAMAREGGDRSLDAVVAGRLSALEAGGVVLLASKADETVARAARLVRQTGADPSVLVVRASGEHGNGAAPWAATFRLGADDPVAFLEVGAP